MIISKEKNFHNPHGFTCQCKCDICNKLFYRKAHWAERTNHHFCSQICASIYKSKEVTGKGNGRWVGGVKERFDGYYTIYDPRDTKVNKYTMQHRFIMEEHLGRKLTKKEVVHHINGDRKDNRIENLMLFSGQKIHRYWHSLYRRVLKILLYSIFKFKSPINIIEI